MSISTTQSNTSSDADKEQRLHDLNIQLEEVNKRINDAREEANLLVNLNKEITDAKAILISKNKEVTEAKAKLENTLKIFDTVNIDMTQAKKDVLIEQAKLDVIQAALSIEMTALEQARADIKIEEDKLSEIKNEVESAGETSKTRIETLNEDENEAQSRLDATKQALEQAETSLTSITTQTAALAVKNEELGVIVDTLNKTRLENEQKISDQATLFDENKKKAEKILTDAKVAAQKIKDDAIEELDQERKSLNNRSGELSLRENWVNEKELDLQGKVQAIEKAIGRKLNIYITPTSYVPKNSTGNG